MKKARKEAATVALDENEFSNMLLRLKALQQIRHDKEVTAAEAEEDKKRAYSEELDQQRAIIEMWKASRPLNQQYQEFFRMPDGQIVKVENGMIWFEKVTSL